jgi:chromosome segregation ATPase
MSNFPWESGVPRQTATEETPDDEQPQPAPAKPAALAVSADEFAALEERIRRTVDLVKQERQLRAAAEARVVELEARVSQVETEAQAQALSTQQLESELRALRAERDQVRQRVDRLLTQLDALEL